MDKSLVMLVQPCCGTPFWRWLRQKARNVDYRDTVEGWSWELVYEQSGCTGQDVVQQHPFNPSLFAYLRY